MTIISKGNPYITFINVFYVDPADQEKLVEILTTGTRNVVESQDGFVSSALHRSLDGTKVVMYAQWQTMDHYNRMRTNQGAAELFKKATEISEFEWGMYDVVEEFGH